MLFCGLMLVRANKCPKRLMARPKPTPLLVPAYSYVDATGPISQAGHFVHLVIAPCMQAKSP